MVPVTPEYSRSILVYEFIRTYTKLVRDLFDGREVWLVFVPLYAAKMVHGEINELGELFLGHEILYTVCPHALTNIHDFYCRYLTAVSELFASHRSSTSYK